MSNLIDLTIEDTKMLARARKGDSYKNMSSQQLERLFIIPSTFAPAPRPASRPKKTTPIPAPRPKQPTPLHAPRPALGPNKHTRLKPCRGWAVLHRGTNDQTVLRLKKHPPLSIQKDYKPNRIAWTFNDKYIEYKSEGEKLTVGQYLENIELVT